MTIAIAKAELKLASIAARAGNHIMAARHGLNAQLHASRSRSKFANDIKFDGHGFAVGRGTIAASSMVYSQEVKSEAGRIVSESKFRIAH